jgi:hypothetical protein
MINGESYKVIVAEAAKNALGMENIYERVFIVKLLTDKNNSNRVCGAVGFSVREHKKTIYRILFPEPYLNVLLKFTLRYKLLHDRGLRRRGQRLPAPVGG